MAAKKKVKKRKVVKGKRLGRPKGSKNKARSASAANAKTKTKLLAQAKALIKVIETL